MDLREIIENRTNLLIKAKDSLKLQAVEIESCKRDIFYWFDNYAYTEKNRTFFSDNEPTIVPFILFEFQREYVEEVWESITEGNKPIKDRKKDVLTNVFIEKSRQMGISWVTAAIFLYGFLFHKHKYTIISRTAEEVDKSGDMDSIFEKIRFMIRNLPKRMLPTGFSRDPGKNSSNSYMNISDPNSEASITGKTANAHAGRGGTRTAIFMDEMASMQYAHEINMAAGSNTPCRIFNSTPNGEGNEFFRMRKLTQWRKGVNGENIPPQVKGLRYHRTDHPFYDEDWYNWKIQGMSNEEIAQELDIDYNVAIKGRVYPSFPKDSSVLTYNIERPLYIAIDNSHGGADPNAIIVIQPEDQYWNVIDSIEVHQSPELCAQLLACEPTHQLSDLEMAFLDRYRKYHWQKAIFISDPYDTHSALGSSTIYDDYRKVGINLCIPDNRDKLFQIRKTSTNIYRIRYNDNCLTFASALMNARYPERPENSNATSEIKKPVHNWTSHYRTALEYFVTYYTENEGRGQKEQLKDDRVKRDMRTGKLYYPHKRDYRVRRNAAGVLVYN